MRNLLVLALALLALVGLAIGDVPCSIGERGCTRDEFLNVTEYYKLCRMWEHSVDMKEAEGCCIEEAT